MPPPFVTGVRTAVGGDARATLLRLFRTVHPSFDPASTDAQRASMATADAEDAPPHMPVNSLGGCEYEDNGQSRAYYVRQKSSRYCLRADRAHAKTYGQLYVTYGSVKYRCFSNDCCDKCVVIEWADVGKWRRTAAAANTAAAGHVAAGGAARGTPTRRGTPDKRGGSPAKKAAASPKKSDAKKQADATSSDDDDAEADDANVGLDIRAALFPPLTRAELRRRYPWQAALFPPSADDEEAGNDDDDVVPESA